VPDEVAAILLANQQISKPEVFSSPTVLRHMSMLKSKRSHRVFADGLSPAQAS
jgi:hypothetical protein